MKHLLKKLNTNNLNGHFVENEVELLKKIDELLTQKETVSVGGSMTLFETGIIDHLKEKNIKFYNRYEAKTPEEIEEIYFQSFGVDSYITSTNALTEDGYLVNVDGRGNRVAAMIYGPKQVIVVVGKNKIVKDEEEAEKRIKRVAAPKNAKRLKRNTPCILTDECVNCKSPEKICHNFTTIKSSPFPNRIHVIIVGKELGY